MGASNGDNDPNSNHDAVFLIKSWASPIERTDLIHIMTVYFNRSLGKHSHTQIQGSC